MLATKVSDDARQDVEKADPVGGQDEMGQNERARQHHGRDRDAEEREQAVRLRHRGKEGRERVHDQRPEHDQEGEREQRHRADQHQPQRLEPQHPPGSRLDKAVGAIEPDSKRFDSARSEIEREDRAEGEQSAAARGRQNPLDLVGDRASHNIGPLGEDEVRRLMRELLRAEEPGERRDENEEREQRSQQRQADVAGDRPAVIGGEFLRRLPDDSQACAHLARASPSTRDILARRGGERHPGQA